MAQKTTSIASTQAHLRSRMDQICSIFASIEAKFSEIYLPNISSFENMLPNQYRFFSKEHWKPTLFVGIARVI